MAEMSLLHIQKLLTCCVQEKRKIEAQCNSVSEKLTKLNAEHASVVVSLAQSQNLLQILSFPLYVDLFFVCTGDYM